MSHGPSSAAAHGPGAIAAQSTPRAMILKMELENFKSYGGIKEIGPFHRRYATAEDAVDGCHPVHLLDSAATPRL